MPRIPRLSREETRQFQAHVKQGIWRLAQGIPWWIAPKINYGLRITNGRLDSHRVATSQVDFSAFEVFETLTVERDRFHFCQRCRRPFIARKRQVYCTPKCSQAVRSQRYRKKDPERFRRLRRQGYERQVRASLGPSVRIASRAKGIKNPSSE